MKCCTRGLDPISFSS